MLISIDSLSLAGLISATSCCWCWSRCRWHLFSPDYGTRAVGGVWLPCDDVDLSFLCLPMTPRKATQPSHLIDSDMYQIQQVIGIHIAQKAYDETAYLTTQDGYR